MLSLLHNPSYTTQFTEAERLVKRVSDLSASHFGEKNLYQWKTLNTLGKIRRAENAFAEALDIDLRAQEVIEKINGKESIERFISLDAVASDYAMLGRVDKAIEIREKAIQEYKKILESDSPELWIMKTNLAENYLMTKEYSKTVASCDEILDKLSAFFEEATYSGYAVKPFRLEAKAQNFSGNLEKAVDFYGALWTFDELRRAASGLISGTENGDNEWFKEAIASYKELVMLSLAKGEKEKNFVDSHIVAFLYSEFCKGRTLLDLCHDPLVNQKQLFDEQEKARLRNFQNYLAAYQDIIDYATVIRDETLRSNAEMNFITLNLDYRNFKGTLRSKYAPKTNSQPAQNNDLAESEMYGSLTGFTTLLNIEKTQQSIPDGACFISFLKVDEENLLAFVLRRDSANIESQKIAVEPNFFAKCRLYHDLLAYADMAEMHNDGKYLWQTANGKYTVTSSRTPLESSAKSVNDNTKFNEIRQELSNELLQKLITPIENFVASSNHWIISPDAEINFVPFETFSYNGKMLVDSVDISYVPSLTILSLMKERGQKNLLTGDRKELFAMGDAIYGDNAATSTRGSKDEFFKTLKRSSEANEARGLLNSIRWSNLPGTAKEIERVSTLFESKDIFSKAQANERNIKRLNQSGELAKYKYFLFATHGLFVPEFPSLSSIVLSQGMNDSDNDGYITVSEWMNYDLRSDLIYLSACESGLGDYQTGEGIIGIPYALTVAGNKDTVMSLWKVNDEATAEFTSAVFEKLSKGKSEVSALNETKREFLQGSNPKYKNPSVWAAFVLYGI